MRGYCKKCGTMTTHKTVARGSKCKPCGFLLKNEIIEKEADGLLDPNYKKKVKR